MNTQTFAAVLMAWAPLKSRGASASSRRIDNSSAASTRLRGRSSERSARSMAGSTFGDGVEALRPPHQDRHHQQDVGGERDLGGEITRVVGHLRDQQGAEEAAANRSQAA